ncbi:MAG TPA: hypothetical protein PLX10_01360 [Candidatus Paceibacterota bacterium]|nr:hypothetical protein [Candidatus Paceibacterota bacterium]
MSFNFFSLLKILSLLFSLFLVWRIMVYYKKLDLWHKKINNWREVFWLNRTPLIILRRRYQKAEKLMNSNNRAAWQIALLQADGIVKTVIGEIGYRGKDLSEMLGRLLPEVLDEETKFNLKLANQVCHQIVEKQYSLDRSEAQKYLFIYKEGLEKLGIKIS